MNKKILVSALGALVLVGCSTMPQMPHKDCQEDRHTAENQALHHVEKDNYKERCRTSSVSKDYESREYDTNIWAKAQPSQSLSTNSSNDENIPSNRSQNTVNHQEEDDKKPFHQQVVQKNSSPPPSRNSGSGLNYFPNNQPVSPSKTKEELISELSMQPQPAEGGWRDSVFNPLGLFVKDPLELSWQTHEETDDPQISARNQYLNSNSTVAQTIEEAGGKAPAQSPPAVQNGLQAQWKPENTRDKIITGIYRPWLIEEVKEKEAIDDRLQKTFELEDKLIENSPVWRKLNSDQTEGETQEWTYEGPIESIFN